jgi:hypothetical protein
MFVVPKARIVKACIDRPQLALNYGSAVNIALVH